MGTDFDKSEQAVNGWAQSCTRKMLEKVQSESSKLHKGAYGKVGLASPPFCNSVQYIRGVTALLYG